MINTDRTTLLSSIAAFGAAQMQAEDTLANPCPPKLEAAMLMAHAAVDGVITMADTADLTKAYFQGKLPGSAAQQQSKFGVFVKTGAAGIALATHEVCQTCIRQTNDAKVQAKMKSGIFEKTVHALRDALKLGRALEPSEARLILLPPRDEEDAEIKSLRAAIASLNAANDISTVNYLPMVARIEEDIVAREKVLAAQAARMTPIAAPIKITPPVESAAPMVISAAIAANDPLSDDALASVLH